MDDSRYQPVSVGNWMITYLIMCIPFVNMIMLFVWSFGGGSPISKENWAKASLLWMLIALIFYTVLFLTVGVGAIVAGAGAGI